MKNFTLMLLICIPFFLNAQVSIDTVFYENFNQYEDSTRFTGNTPFTVWEGPAHVLNPATNPDAGSGYDGSAYGMGSNKKTNFAVFRDDTLNPGIIYVFEAVTKIENNKVAQLQLRGGVTGGNVNLKFNHADWQRHKISFTVDTAGTPVKTRLYHWPKVHMAFDNWILRTADSRKSVEVDPFGAIDETNKTVEYPENTTVTFLKENIKPNLNGTLNVLDATGGSPVADSLIVTGTMVIEVMAEDSTKQEYSITLIPMTFATSMAITTEKDSLAVGSTLQLAAEVLPADATLKNVAWSVDDSKIASIDENGLFTALDSGIVNIVAKTVDGTNLMDTLVIKTYIQPVETITVSADVDSVLITNTLQMSAEVLPADASNGAITWSVSPVDEGASATISETGLLTPLEIGVVQVIATASDSSGIVGSMNINIYPITLVASIEITANSDSIKIDGGLLLIANVSPANTTDNSITWSVEAIDEGAEATIDNRGILTGVAEGMVKAIATANDASGVVATIEIMVYAPVSTVNASNIAILGMKLYPNPANNELNIVTGSDNSKYRIHNSQGQFVRTGEFSMQTTVNVKALTKGLYFVEIGSGLETKVLKFIKE